MGEPDRPYRPPRAPLFLGARPSDEWLAAFVGPNTDTYLARWRGLREDSSRLAGFHWPAALFGLYWLCYRRLYPWAVLHLVVNGLIGLLPFERLPAGLAAHAQLVAGLGAAVAWGLAANVILYRRALRVIGEAASLEAVREAGGVSERAMWLAIALMTALGLLALTSTVRA